MSVWITHCIKLVFITRVLLFYASVVMWINLHTYLLGLKPCECVHLANRYQYIFSVSLKFGVYYITGQWGEFIKRCLLVLSYTFLLLWHFFLFVFDHKICVLIYFICFSFFLFFFFYEVLNFRNRIPTNQKNMNWWSQTVSGTVYYWETKKNVVYEFRYEQTRKTRPPLSLSIYNIFAIFLF